MILITCKILLIVDFPDYKHKSQICWYSILKQEILLNNYVITT